ncbi:MAG: hypothetical protein MPJ06_08535 [Nitrosopumilus sp.]|nr:hypothetical protein [Nitrosopumilus sp.]MDA7944026.1 hypothetical protein [Nitrosopumilus sp.]MDA7999271.1 hypothetical protein [Nitrosopumilus sp.]
MGRKDSRKDDGETYDVTEIGKSGPRGVRISEITSESTNELAELDNQAHLLQLAQLKVADDMNKRMDEHMKNIEKRLSILPKDWKQGLAALGGLVLVGMLIHAATRWMDVWLPF